MILKNINSRINPSFTFTNRLYRFVWGMVQNTFFRFSPRSCHFFRKIILMLFGAKIGKNTHIYNKVTIWSPKNLVIKNNVGIADNVNLYNIDKIIIGDLSTISQGSFLCTGSHDYNSKNFQLISKPICIKNNVWICAEVFIHPGITINDGCVIGARSVVTKNLEEEYTIYAGNPCIKIKSRKRSE